MLNNHINRLCLLTAAALAALLLLTETAMTAPTRSRKARSSASKSAATQSATSKSATTQSSARSSAATQPSTSSTCYLFSYFTDDGRTGLHLAYSNDAFNWTPLKRGESFLNTWMRDPFICRGQDGTYHLTWSMGWQDRSVGMAHSKDLIHWTKPQPVKVMEQEPKAINGWAPEIVYDRQNSQYVIYWSSTVPGRFPDTDNTGDPAFDGYTWNHRIFFTTTKDFRTYSPSRLLFNDGFNCIDANIVPDGNRYVLFVKDETLKPTPKKQIRLATADRATGPYSHAGPPITPDWVEGPAAIKIGDKWHVYFDLYFKGRYGVVTSTDLVHWQDESDRLNMVRGARHGCVFAVPRNTLDKLLKE